MDEDGKSSWVFESRKVSSYHHPRYLCCLHIQKSSYSYMSVPPLKKKNIKNPYAAGG